MMPNGVGHFFFPLITFHVIHVFPCKEKGEKGKERKGKEERMKEMVELNDDLTVEILQRMPLKSIFRCRCVCRNWQSLISHHPLLRCFGQGMGGKLYVVFVGRQPGIYTSWEECHTQVNGYKGAYHCSFPTLREAEDCFRKFQLDKFAYTRVRRNSACGIFMLLFLVFVFFNVLVL